MDINLQITKRYYQIVSDLISIYRVIIDIQDRGRYQSW